MHFMLKVKRVSAGLIVDWVLRRRGSDTNGEHHPLCITIANKQPCYQPTNGLDLAVVLDVPLTSRRIPEEQFLVAQP